MEPAYEYLSLLPRELDDRQRQVCCHADNTVVAAGAGSGKTQVLATRFAWLVMSRHVPASKILTLTYTNKAAGEMYERIYSTLGYLSEHPQTPAAEHDRARQALASFGDTHIQTLDSYCAALVRQAANRYGIRPDFTAGSADTEREIKDAALPFVLKHRDNRAVQAFAEAGRLQEFAEDVLAKTVSLYTAISDSDTCFTDRLPAQTRKVAEDFNWFLFAAGTKPPELDDAANLHDAADALSEALSATPKASDYTTHARRLLAFVAEMQAETEPLPAASAEPFAGFGARELERFSALATLAGGFPSSGATRALKAAVKMLQERTLPYLNALAAYIRQYDDIRALFSLFDAFHTQIKRTKRISGRLSFRDIQKLALRVLQEQDDIRAQEYAAYDKIMIDEFQDNNGENRELLFLLCSPPGAGPHPPVTSIARDKLFFVGDEKQSIYKFRGADVSVFNELQSDFAATFGAGSVLPMEYNYRSTNALITSFNLLFGGKNGIFDPSIAADYEAQYPKEKETKKYDKDARKALPAETLSAETVPLHFCVLNRQHFKENDALEADERLDYLEEKEQLAYFIAKKIDSLCKAGTSYGSIALLDRSRTDRGTLVKWLNAFGIPYRVDKNSSIFASGLVYDIYSFLRLCVYPGDRNALAAYLASPLAGMSEQEVEAALADTASVCANGDGEADGADAAHGSDGGAGGDSNAALQAAYGFLEQNRVRVLSQPLTKTLELLWDGIGYRYETMLSTRAAQCAEQFDLLYELARQCDTSGKGAAWFVDQLALLRKAEDARLSDDAELDAQDVTYPVEKDDAVQILTIHKSKGLQFDHVFVYGCFSPRSKSENSLVFFEEGYGASVKPKKGSDNYFFLLQKELAKKKELAEFRRLIYVAITRATTDVYVVGAITPAKDTKEGTVSLKLLEKQLDTYYPDWKAGDLAYALDHAEYQAGAPFDFLSLMPVERTVLQDIQREAPAEAVREALISRLSPVYAAATPIETAPEKTRRIAPSALEHASDATTAPATADPYAASVNAILEKYAPKGSPLADGESAALLPADAVPQSAAFTHADFGTLAHACLEAAAQGVPLAQYEPDGRLFKNLAAKERDTVLSACRDMAARFMRSELGTALSRARGAGRLCKTEYAFRTVIADRRVTGSDDALLVTGAIDLLFEDDESQPCAPHYTLVDYKTDQSIHAATYYAQQSCYRTAAARLLGCDEAAISCYLYYLRFAQAVDITSSL